MLLKEAIKPTELKQESREILLKGTAFFCLVNDEDQGEERIYWRSYEDDTELFGVLVTLITSLHKVSDEVFISHYLQLVEELLNTSALFQALKNNKLTTKDRTDYDHMIDVLRMLKTEALKPEIRTLLRLAALFWNVGKVTTSNQEGIELRDEYESISALVLLELFKNKKAAAELENCMLGGSANLLYLILNQRIFEKIQKKAVFSENRSDGRQSFDSELRKEFGNLSSKEWVLLLHIFLLVRDGFYQAPFTGNHRRGVGWIFNQLLLAFWSELDWEIRGKAISYLRLTLKTI